MTTTGTTTTHYDPVTTRYTFASGIHTIAYSIVKSGDTCDYAVRTRRTTFPTPPTRCGGTATYFVGGSHYCTRHAKQNYPDVVAAIRAAGGAT